ncbi:MFS general substrate transporter [Cadophora sp. DSE1049]|nr:MFS general substrate transporter [Cadophora sp. DSE1049]
MYLFNSVDRSNLGNAKTDGLEKDLGMTGNQYANTLVIFYVTFCLLDLPSNLLLKKFTAKYWLPFLMTGWGSMTLLQCAAHNWAGLVTLRVFMGAFEAGFFAGIIFYLTTFYKRDEIAFRLALFYGAATIAGAFSGLVAFGVFQIHHDSVPGWKFLMIIEGGITVLLAAFAVWWLPESAAKCKWLTEEEKAMARARMLQDSSKVTDEKLDIKFAVKKILDWRIMAYAILAFSYGTASSIVGNFLPQLVGRLGYSSIKTNLYTVAPFVCGCFILLLTCRSSDHFRERSFHMAFALSLTLIGLIILATVDTVKNKGVAYFACFMLTSGAFTPSCIFHSWHNNNEATENGRAAITGFLVGAANSGGIFSSLSFNAKTAPKYIPAIAMGAAFQGLGIVIILSLGFWFRRDNRERDEKLGRVLKPQDVSTSTLTGGYDDPNWRWTS